MKHTVLFGIVVILTLVDCYQIPDTEYFQSLSKSEGKPLNTCQLPRIRRSWVDLSDAEKNDYTRVVAAMKKKQIKYNNQMGSLYDYFAEVHNRNTAYYHYSSFFLPVHRYFLWKFESAVQYIARTEGPNMTPPITDFCLTVPYWPWDVDCNVNGTNQNNSVIFAGGYVGPKPNPKSFNCTVGSGAFAGWTVGDESNTMCGDPNRRTGNDPKCGPKDKLFKRYFDKSVVFKYDSAQVFQLAVTSNYWAFTNKFEGWHGLPHSWIGFSMSTQKSPYDPIFFMHHAQVDRVFAIWQDCWEYDSKTPNSLTNLDDYYNASVWSKSAPSNFEFQLDDKIPYQLSSSDTGPFAGVSPTARQVYDMGTETNPAFEGMYFRYGPDAIVSKLSVINNQPVCKKNTKWTLVNQPLSSGSYKRQIDNSAVFNRMLQETNETVNFDKLQQRLTEFINKAKIAKKTGLDALNYIISLMCPYLPQAKVSESVVAFIEGNGGGLEHLANLDSICDNSSRYFCIDNPTHHWCTDDEENDSKAEEMSKGETMNPLFAVAWTAVGVVGVISLLLIVIIIVVIVRVSRKSDPEEFDHYTKM